MSLELTVILPLVLLVGTIVALFFLVSLLSRNYIKVPPNKAAVFFGKRHGDKGYVVVTGGAKFKWPLIEDVQYMDMAIFQLKVHLEGIPNVDGVKVNLDAVATCKIRSEQSSLMTAVERFLGKSPEEVHITVRENLEGQLRSVIGTMTVEDLIKDREKLNSRVKAEAATELDNIGVGIDILNIQSITDDYGYIDALGKKRNAEVMRDADIGRAEAERDAKQLSTTAAKDGSVRAAENDALIAQAEKERDVKKAQFHAEVAAEQARAAQAGPRSQAEAEQEVVREQVKVEEERQRATIAVKTQAVQVAEQEQEAAVVIPSRKRAEAAVATADGERIAAIKAAEGEKQKRVLEGDGEAARIRAIGLAEAAAVQAKLEAEAAGVLKKAEAYKAMDQSAALQLILEKLPSILEKVAPVMAAVAEPLKAIDKVVIIDQGSGGGPGGVQRFVNNVPATLFSLFQTARQMGFNLEPLLSKVGIDASAIVDEDAASTGGANGPAAAPPQA